MEKQSDFIWEIIEHTPVLRRSINKLEAELHPNHDELVKEYIDFFRELELMIEEINHNIALEFFFSHPRKPVSGLMI